MMLTLVWAVLPLQMSWTGLVAGLAVSAVTHAFFDRRWPIRWLLEHIGSKGFAKLKAAGTRHVLDRPGLASDRPAGLRSPDYPRVTWGF
ncbi:hypothetical protein [Streptomyces sp. NPDC001933]|uniref:hypothetical protein n=1 Tax=Streptomyces sp. NPDC001933 TaxID=3364626 RepID=UPI0036ABBD68